MSFQLIMVLAYAYKESFRVRLSISQIAKKTANRILACLIKQALFRKNIYDEVLWCNSLIIRSKMFEDMNLKSRYILMNWNNYEY